MSSASTPAGGQHVCRYLSEKEKEHEPHSCMKKTTDGTGATASSSCWRTSWCTWRTSTWETPRPRQRHRRQQRQEQMSRSTFFLAVFFFYHPQWLVPFSIVGCGGACPCCAAGAVPSLPSLSLALFSLVMSHSFARTHAQKPLTDTYLFFPFFSLFFPCPTLIKPPTAQQPRGKEAALPLGRVLA